MMKPYRLELKDGNLDKVKIIWNYVDKKLPKLCVKEIKHADYHFPICANDEKYCIKINTYNPFYIYMDPASVQKYPYHATLPSRLVMGVPARYALFLASHLCTDYKNIIYYMRTDSLLHISDYAIESSEAVDIYLQKHFTMHEDINIQIKILNRLIAEISCYSSATI